MLTQYIADLKLCIWTLVATDGRFETTVDDGGWTLTIAGSDGATVEQTIRIPADSGHMPDLHHPEWPAVRETLTRLRAASVHPARRSH